MCSCIVQERRAHLIKNLNEINACCWCVHLVLLPLPCRCRWYVQFSIFRSFESGNCVRHFMGLAFGPLIMIILRAGEIFMLVHNRSRSRRRLQFFCFFLLLLCLSFHFRVGFFLPLSLSLSSRSFIRLKNDLLLLFYYSLCIDKTDESFSSLNHIKFRQRNSANKIIRFHQNVYK